MNADSMEMTALNREISYAGLGLVTSNPRMLGIIDTARRVAQTDVNVAHRVMSIFYPSVLHKCDPPDCRHA